MAELSDPYSYKPIQSDEVRLCRFVKETDHIWAKLVTFSVNQLPLYQTLSYVWSEDGREACMNWHIMVDGRRLNVLDSLQPFFNALRDKDLLLDGTWWWIDSICINQADEEERNQQVKLMRRLYSDCSACIIWLGEPAGHDDEAVDFIQDIDRLGKRNVSDEIRKKYRQEENQLPWSLLLTFLSRRWWTRVWTLQEFICPPAVNFWYGRTAISRSAVSRAILFTETCAPPYVIESAVYRQAWNRRRIWLRHNNFLDVPPQYARLSLPALAAYCCANEASQPLDRLYGLMALVMVDRDLVTVNYAQSVEDSYRAYIKSFLFKHHSLDICLFATMFPPLRESGLPSWIPDWRRSTGWGRKVLPLMVSQSGNACIGNLRPIWSVEDEGELVRYAASGNKTAAYTIEANRLSAAGIKIDQIESPRAVGDASTDSVERAASNSIGNNDILLAICRCLSLGRGDRYLGLPMPEDKYMKEFLRLCSQCLADPTVDGKFSKWFEASKELQIYGQRLGEIIRQCVSELDPAVLEEAPEHYGLDEDTHSFRGRFIDTVRGMTFRMVVTSLGRLAMIPKAARDGDFVCVLYGCSVPVLLRRVDRADDAFTLVGECYVDLLMHGEALSLGLEEFTFHVQ